MRVRALTAETAVLAVLIPTGQVVVAEAQVARGRSVYQVGQRQTHGVPAVQVYGLRLLELPLAVRAVAEVAA